MRKEFVLLDDGEFYIERNCNGDPATANGFLLRRCAFGRTTPGGYEVVGGYQRNVMGEWRADVAAPYDEASDSDSQGVGQFKTDLDAIAALWAARHQAHCRH